MKRYIIILSAFLVLVSSCVYTFEPKDVKNQEGILAIEGDINIGDQSVFVLSKSIKISDLEETKVSSVEASAIYVEDYNGTQYRAVKETVEDENYKDGKKTTYTVNTASLDTNKRYRLVVKYAGKEYASLWNSFLKTAPIDSISYTVDRSMAHKGVTINVSTTGLNDSLLYYKWDYAEDWEFKSRFYAIHYYNPEEDEVEPLPFTENKYYCWKHTRSTDINVFSAESLTENRVVNHSLLFIPSANYRISYIYSIEVYQKAISKEAYTYWETMRKNNDGTGGIFSPQPSEMRGNIECVDDPDEPVLGYISVCNIQKKRIFIYNDEIAIYDERQECTDEIIEKPKWWSYYFYNHWDVVYKDDMTGEVHWSEKICVDCRTRGTKNRPVFWPEKNKDI